MLLLIKPSLESSLCIIELHVSHVSDLHNIYFIWIYNYVLHVTYIFLYVNIWLNKRCLYHTVQIVLSSKFIYNSFFKRHQYELDCFTWIAKMPSKYDRIQDRLPREDYLSVKCKDYIHTFKGKHLQFMKHSLCLKAFLSTQTTASIMHDFPCFGWIGWMTS